MPPHTILNQSEQLTILYRVEPGCLGPDGLDHIARFCAFAHAVLRSIDVGFIQWQIEPRYDKQLPELEYHLGQRRLTEEMAHKYLLLLNRNPTEFEEQLHQRMSRMVLQFLKA